MTLLLFGATGQIGGHLARLLPALGETRAVLRTEVDLAQPGSIREAIRASRPGVIVNAAAYNEVDRAESEPALAHAINAAAPAVMAEEARRSGALLVHYSTAFVFDGTSGAPYLETDAPNPISEYGRSKLAGEEAVKASGAAHLILRTNWVYDARGRNFVKTLLELAGARDELRVVGDQVGAPTWAKAVAEATYAILADEGRARAAAGIYHLTALGSVTRCDFVRTLCRLAGKQPRIVPVASAEFPTAAKRPASSVLDNTKVQSTFGVKLRTWEDDLASWFAERER